MKNSKKSSTYEHDNCTVLNSHKIKLLQVKIDYGVSNSATSKEEIKIPKILVIHHFWIDINSLIRESYF